MPERRAVMLLIVTSGGCLLMHRRDDKPGILHPGCWAGFGGAVEDGETRLEALRREVREEIGVDVKNPEFLVDELDVEGAGDLVSLYFTHSDISLEDIDLQEGAGVGIHAIEELRGLTITPFVRRAIELHLVPRISSEGPG